MALFDSSPLIPNSKFTNFLWVCWFLGKNLSNFVSPVWKLHNPYCHRLTLTSHGFGFDCLHKMLKTQAFQHCTIFSRETFFKHHSTRKRQGDLLRDIDIWSGAVYIVQGPKPSFQQQFSTFTSGVRSCRSSTFRRCTPILNWSE